VFRGLQRAAVAARKAPTSTVQLARYANSRKRTATTAATHRRKRRPKLSNIQEPFFLLFALKKKRKIEAFALVYFTAYRASPAISHLRTERIPLAASRFPISSEAAYFSARDTTRSRRLSKSFFSLHHPSGGSERKRKKKEREGVTPSLYTRLSVSSLISV